PIATCLQVESANCADPSLVRNIRCFHPQTALAPSAVHGSLCGRRLVLVVGPSPAQAHTHRQHPGSWDEREFSQSFLSPQAPRDSMIFPNLWTNTHRSP